MKKTLKKSLLIVCAFWGLAVSAFTFAPGQVNAADCTGSITITTDGDIVISGKCTM